MSHLSAIVSHMATSYDFEVKEKGRAVLPAGLRSECGFDVGVRVVAYAVGPGRAILETTDAVIERIWSGAPAHTTDGVEELKRWRAEQASALSAAEPEYDGDADAGERLLEVLGLV
jgi:bifunctional DNA-binding transcriptional regulator/antitoxin component of YhaV-PrlF toxin-antitoxin module